MMTFLLGLIIGVSAGYLVFALMCSLSDQDEHLDEQETLQECPLCQGFGRLDTREPCSDCGGRGYYYVAPTT